MPALVSVFDILKVSEPTRLALELAIAKAAAERGEAEIFYTYDAFNKESVPRMSAIPKGTISFSAEDALLKGMWHTRPLIVTAKIGGTHII